MMLEPEICTLSEAEAFEAIHCAIQEAMQGNLEELESTLAIVEILREEAYA
jgi:hypothetical protein